MKRRAAELPLFDHTISKVATVVPRPVHGPLSTGLPSVDQLLEGGLLAGQGTLLAARPRMGASSFLLGATLATLRHQHAVAYLSERVPERALRGRLVLLESRVNGYRLSAGIVTAEDRQALTAARERIAWSHLSLLAQPRISLDDVARHIARYRPALAIADLSMRGGGGSPWHTAGGLVELAARYGTAIVWRLILPRADAAPRRTDLPGQGAIAQRFDTVLLLHREEVALPSDGEAPALGLAEITRLRHASHDTAPGRVQLRFDQRFAGLLEL